MIRLYYSPGACSLAAHTALEEVAADYEIKTVDLKAGEQKSPEYLAVNPKAAVPALVTDEGILTENVAILPWIAATWPAAELAPAPEDLAEYAAFMSFLGFLSSTVHPAMGRLLFNKEPDFDEAARGRQRDLVVGKLRLLEDHLVAGPWAMGEQFTVADPYLGVFERWARQADLLDKTDFHKLNAHLDVIQARPATIAALKAEGLAPA